MTELKNSRLLGSTKVDFHSCSRRRRRRHLFVCHICTFFVSFDSFFLLLLRFSAAAYTTTSFMMKAESHLMASSNRCSFVRLKSCWSFTRFPPCRSYSSVETSILFSHGAGLGKEPSRPLCEYEWRGKTGNTLTRVHNSPVSNVVKLLWY